MKKKRGEKKKQKKKKKKKKKQKRKGMETMILYGNFEYGMLCFCMELVWKLFVYGSLWVLYGY